MESGKGKQKVAQEVDKEGKVQTKKLKENPITDEDIICRGIELVSGSERVELEKKWKELQIKGLKHDQKKYDLFKVQGELMLNAKEKSNQDEDEDEDEDEVELKKKWKEWQIEELKLHQKKLDLFKEQEELILNAMATRGYRRLHKRMTMLKKEKIK